MAMCRGTLEDGDKIAREFYEHVGLRRYISSQASGFAIKGKRKNAALTRRNVSMMVKTVP